MCAMGSGTLLGGSMQQGMKKISQGALALALMMLASSAALAGGFAVHEQSASFMGAAFAGSAAGGVLSSMFWNPAALGQFDGITSDSNYSLILADTEITATGVGPVRSRPSRSSGDIGDTAVLPASYMSYQLNEQMVLGLGSTRLRPDDRRRLNWAGRAWRANRRCDLQLRADCRLSCRAGRHHRCRPADRVHDAQLRSCASGAPFGPTAAIKGDDVGFGFTAGILLTPAAGTSIGLGFRSKIEHEPGGLLPCARHARPERHQCRHRAS